MANLTALKIKGLKPGPKTQRVADGRGLYIVIRPSGSRAWVLRCTLDGTRTDLGIGPFPDVSLARAREKAQEIRGKVVDGHDPRAERRQPKTPTFSQAAEQYITQNERRWKSPREARDWRACLESYAYSRFGNIRVDKVTRNDVLKALLPIWPTVPARARKLRQRIKTIFAAAMAHGHLDVNPAGEVIDAALPRRKGVPEHHRSLPYQKVGAALNTVEESTSGLAVRLCFRFLVLTSVRSGEARGATWDEIDLERREWTVPGARMKAGVSHRVPLSDAALDVLRRARALGTTGLVFPSAGRKRPLTDMALMQLLRRTGLAGETTVHGLRASFRTWSQEQTDTPWAVGEAALAHTIGNSTEAAYARSDLYQKRAELMEEWGSFLLRTPERSRGDYGNPVLNADANYVHRGAAPQDVEGTADTNGRPYDLL